MFFDEIDGFGNSSCYYGTCSTVSSTAAKTSSITNFSLTTGVQAIIKFTYPNSASSPTLNISSTGAKDIYTYGTTRSGLGSFSENSIIHFVYDGSYWLVVSILDGYDCVASSICAHAEGYCTTADGQEAHAEGNYTTAGNTCAHAEGYYTTANGQMAHTEGYYTTADGRASHAEGYYTTADGQVAHVEGGYINNGTYNVASGYGSHAEGSSTEASGSSSHAEGVGTTANNLGMHAGGKYNKSSSSTTSGSSNTGDVFVLGNGTGSSSLSNAFRVTYAGAVYGLSSFNSSGADYAEFIKPWADGNPDEEDRVGYFVTVKDGMLYKASSGDYIAGITSGNPSIVGNSDEDYYHKYERDEFNRIIWEDTTIIKEPKNDESNYDNGYEEYGIIECHNMKISEDYDNTLQDAYVERKDRPEWDYVGMIGVLPVRDDGTCEAGGFAKCGDDGIATYADSWTIGTYYVIERISDSVVSIIFK